MHADMPALPPLCSDAARHGSSPADCDRQSTLVELVRATTGPVGCPDAVCLRCGERGRDDGSDRVSPDCERTGRKSCFGADRPRGDAGAAMRPPDRPRYAHGHRPNHPNPAGPRARKNPGSATAVRRPPPVPVGTAALRCAGPAANLTGFVFDSRLQIYEHSPSWTRSMFWHQSSIYFLPFLFVCLRVCAWT